MIQALILASVGFLSTPADDGPEVVQVGHWLQVRGRFDDEGRLVAERVEIIDEERYETIIGVVGKDQRAPDSFVLLGQPVEVGDGVDFKGMRRGDWAGKRIKLEGRWRNARKFSAREIEHRGGSGRERLEGRVDEIERVPEGYLAEIMSFRVLLPAGVEVDHEKPLDQYPLTEVRGEEITDEILEDRGDDLDDLFGGGIAVYDGVRLFGQLSTSLRTEDNYNLDDGDDEDEQDYSTRARLRVHWLPRPDLILVAEGNIEPNYKVDEDGHDGTTADINLGETFAYWLNAFGVRGLDFQVGRQDFDDEREWIYDQNLDAFRVFYTPNPDLRFEVSLSTLLGGSGGERDDHALNSILYVSNNDEDRHLAGYVVYRDIGTFLDGSGTSVPDEQSLHVGGRILGDWLPDHKSWLELAWQGGDRNDRDVSAFAYDLGTTWSPEFADPLYFTLGYALGSGERSATGTDGRYQQTGLQDNNARFGGVSSFRYYGELLQPELSNLGILTAGVGTRFWDNDASIDLIWHDYRFDVVDPAFNVREFTDLKVNTAVDDDLGWELDLVLGLRTWKRWDIELTTAYFEPGDAFPGADDALLARLQIRYRF